MDTAAPAPRARDVLPTPRGAKHSPLTLWTRSIFAGWIALLLVVGVTEPPADSDGTLAFWTLAMVPLFLLSLPGALTALFVGARIGLALSAGAAAAGAAIAVGCILDHHGVGVWSMSQLAGFTAVGAVSAAGWHRTRGVRA